MATGLGVGKGKKVATITKENHQDLSEETVLSEGKSRVNCHTDFTGDETRKHTGL